MESKEKQENKGIFSCFRGFFLDCCNPEENDSNDLFTMKSTKASNYLKELQKNLEKVFSIIPPELIRDEECPFLTFTKEGIIDFITKLQSDEYIPIYDEDGLRISTKNSSLLNSDVYLFRSQVTKSKSFFKKKPGIKKIADSIALPEERKNWDKNIKEYKIVDKRNDNTEVIKMITQKQFSIIEEKEFLDKRTRFFDEDIYYSFSSSVPDKLYIPEGEMDRVKDYMGIVVISEDEENYCIDTFNQVDIKMAIPEAFINKNLPIKIKEIFDELFEYVNA